MAGLHVLLTAQFLNIDFGPDASYLSLNDGASDGFEDGIGGYLRVEYPKNVPIADRYDFDWQQLKLTTDPFEPFDFDSIQ